MLEKVPTAEEMIQLVGAPRYGIWTQLTARIEERYDMDRSWNSGGKAWTYEYKYRRGGKTLCALYAREDRVGLLVILGKDERAKFEADWAHYTRETQKIYDEARTYHDGKWLMFTPADTALFEDFLRLLAVKRRPNRK